MPPEHPRFTIAHPPEVQPANHDEPTDWADVPPIGRADVDDAAVIVAVAILAVAAAVGFVLGGVAALAARAVLVRWVLS